MRLPTIQPGTVVALALFLLVGVAIPALLVWRDIIRERRRLATPVCPADSFTDYLLTLRDRLGFVPEQNTEVLDEIEAHLWDTTEALVRSGVDLQDAKRQAMDQLGSPADLAVALRDARREQPRILATVGGGALQATRGFFWGGCAGMLLLGPFLALAMVLLGALSALGLPFVDFDAAREVGLILTTVALGIGLAAGSRRGVETVAAVGHRRIAPVARVWALVVAPVVAWAAIYVVEWEASWPALPFAMGLSIAAAAGALHDLRGWRRIVNRRLLIAVTGVSLTIVLLEVAFARYEGDSPTGEVPGIAAVAPVPPLGTVTRTSEYRDRSGMDAACRAKDGRATCTFTIRDEHHPLGLLSPAFHDLRLEAWPAASRFVTDPVGVDPRSTAPVVVGPARVSGDRVVGTVEIGMRRDGPDWWLVPTGVLWNGTRYRLSDGDGVSIPFKGTTEDWLNAPG